MLVFAVALFFPLVPGPAPSAAAQSCYPPVDPCPPSGGQNNTTNNNTTTNNTTTNNTTTNPSVTNPVGNPAPVGPGSSSGPFCDLAHCLNFSGKVGDTFVVNKVEELGDFRAAAVSGCCDRGARVDVYMESERVYLGTVHAAEDGSYLATFKLPASITAGTHHVIADIGGCGELRRAIEVLPVGSSAGVVPDSTEGTTVLGTTTRNTSADAGGGLLPKTGGDLLRLLLWALAFVLLGTTLVMAAARKRGLRYAWLRLRGAEPVHRPVLALPPPEIPFVDTSRFIPYRSRVGEPRASHDTSFGTTMTEWDTPRPGTDARDP